MEAKYKTLEQRLELYKEALEFWQSDLTQKYTGFCAYFEFHQGMDTYNDEDFERQLPELYIQRVTKGAAPFHYEPWGKDALGRKLRCLALIAAIELTEKEIKKNRQPMKRIFYPMVITHRLLLRINLFPVVSLYYLIADLVLAFLVPIIFMIIQLFWWWLPKRTQNELIEKLDKKIKEWEKVDKIKDLEL